MADLGDIGSTVVFRPTTYAGGNEVAPLFSIDSFQFDYASKGVFEIQGNITELGVAKANAELLISKLEGNKIFSAKRTTTDALGNYIFSGLATGDYLVMPVDRSRVYRSKVIHTTIPGDTSVVEFIGETDVNNAVAGTIATAVPAGAQVDDLLITFVVAGSTVTPPVGWYKETGAQVMVDTQKIEAYSKVATLADLGTSPIFTQSNAAARIGIAMHAYRKTGGCTVLAYNTATKDSAAGFTHESALITNNGRIGNMMVVAQTSTSQGGTFNASTPAGTTQTTPLSEPSGNRLAVGYKSTSKKVESFIGFFAWDGSIATTSVASISLLIG